MYLSAAVDCELCEVETYCSGERKKRKCATALERLGARPFHSTVRTVQILRVSTAVHLLTARLH